MEFCPEVAVLQSAFYLLEQKAGGQLADLPKQRCGEFTRIICSAVEEICAGLEQDNDAEDELLWKQKIHLLVLYSLITKKYTKKQDLPKDCVPVLCTLDTLTGTIPTFSCCFYFELVKLCSWEQFFVDSLAHLSSDTAATLLQDAIYHYMHEPVSQSDDSVAMVLPENLLSHLCSCPVNTHFFLQSLARSLYTKKNYIQTILPAEPDNTENNSIHEPSRTQDELAVDCEDVTDSRLQQKYKFWCLFLEKNPLFMSQMLEIFSKKYISNRTEAVTSKTDHKSMVECLGQLLFLWYSAHVTPNNTATNSWLIYNVYNSVIETGDKPNVMCMLNYPLADCITYQLSLVELLSVIHRCLLVIQKMVQKETESEKTLFDSVIQLVPKVTVKFNVVLRMFGGTLSESKSAEAAVAECQNIIQWLLNRANNDSVSTGSSPAATPGGDVLIGDTWERDITLSALLWRIESGQPQAEACLEELLSDECRQFWYLDRVYDSAESVLFSTKKILKLLKIASHLKSSAPREINLKIQMLILTKFSQLPFPDQDHVIKLNYTEMSNEVCVFEADKAFAINTTNMFNKLTATNDDQVLKHMLQLCLVDPVYIIRGAVERCVRNEDQAVSSAQILQLLYNTCRCHHTQNHPTMSLVASVLNKFVTTVRLNHKEEKSFLTFVTLLMQPQKDSVCQKAALSPLEFLQTTLIPHTSIVHFIQDDAPINFRLALSLLNTSLSASCKTKCDWSSVDLEPLALVVILAQILHECVVLWDNSPEQMKEIPDVNDTAAHICQQFSLLERAAMRDSASTCLEVICEIMENRYIVPEDWHLEWLFEETSCLHWSVQYRLLKLLTCCGNTELAKEWDVVLDMCLKQQPMKQLTSVLVLVGIGGLGQNVAMATVTLDSSSVIASLAQVWPNLVQREFDHVISFLEQLLMNGSITLVDRISLTSNEPVGHWKSAEKGKALGISQILSDVVMTLTWSRYKDSSSHLQMLTHVVQMYVSAIKSQCETVYESQELQLYVQCQLFLHVCHVTEILPAPVSDQTWVLLLNMANQFMTGCTDIVGKSTEEIAVEEAATNWTHCMLMAVQRLPWCEERAMIMKKLNT